MLASRLVLVVAALVLCASNVSAEPVPHHGMIVDANGSFNDCASCHDGSVARNADVCVRHCDVPSSHPVLTPYPPVDKPMDYAPQAVVAAEGIKFENGMITCISCHDLRNPARAHLVMQNDRSRLCSACHVTK